MSLRLCRPGSCQLFQIVRSIPLSCIHVQWVIIHCSGFKNNEIISRSGYNEFSDMSSLILIINACVLISSFENLLTDGEKTDGEESKASLLSGYYRKCQ